MKRVIAPLSALFLMASPVLAQSAAPPQAPAPAAETVEGSELYRTGFVIPLVAVAALILALYATGTWPFDDGEPVSP